MNLALEQVLTQAVAFLVMLWVLKKFFWKPIFSLMEKRKQTIASEFDLIKEQKKTLKKLDEEYHHKLKNIESEAKAMIQEAVEKGQKLAHDIEKQTHEKAKQILEKNQEDVRKEIQQAKIQLKEDIVNIAMHMTQKMVHESLDKNKHKQLIEKAIEQSELK
jgi:F-type H+-transporting ATPase subunit b